MNIITMLFHLCGGSLVLVGMIVFLSILQYFFKQYTLWPLIAGLSFIALGYSIIVHKGAYDQSFFYCGGLIGQCCYGFLATYLPHSIIIFFSWMLLTSGVLCIIGYEGIVFIRAISPWFFKKKNVINQSTISDDESYDAARKDDYNERIKEDKNAEDILILTKPIITDVKHDEEKQYPFPYLEKPAIDQQQTDKNNSHAQNKARILEEKLLRFGIKGSVTSIVVGPVVILYEYQPHIDAKISKIIAREDDLALALQALSLRIIAPIPGKSVVGFEVAHAERASVYFGLLYEPGLKKFKGHLPLLLGQNTVGATVVVDLIHMPHLLVAGSTGSGKSVALNSMLISLICYANPDDLKLILIDPKKLEFAVYDELPHLLFPIVTAPERAVAVLKWAVKTMNERYERISKVGMRHAKEYHAVYNDMASIVIIIDEFADLMITTGKEIEDLIVRLAQMARAAGIHIILATQRPSVDVITGLIKVNFPARIACKVTSKIDSRTIIDTHGADKLLGKGDMLFLDNQGMLNRIHGAYISDAEILSVVSQIKKYGKPIYETIIQDSLLDQSDIDDVDKHLFDQIVLFVRARDEVSISLLQREFRIGYNRSARMMDTLESRGIILPSDGGKMRRVLH